MSAPTVMVVAWTVYVGPDHFAAILARKATATLMTTARLGEPEQREGDRLQITSRDGDSGWIFAEVTDARWVCNNTALVSFRIMSRRRLDELSKADTAAYLAAHASQKGMAPP